MITINDLKKLLKQATEPVLSLYVVIDPAWQTWLKNALKKTENDLDESQQQLWSDIRIRVDDFFASYTPTGKTFVLFFGRTWQEVYELPVILKNDIAFGDPIVTPLMYVLDDYRPYLVTFIDRTKVQLWVITLDGIQHELETSLEIRPEEWRKLTRNERDRRIEDKLERFYKDIGEQILYLTRQYHLDTIVLTGNVEAAHRVSDYVPDKTIIGPVLLDSHTSISEVLKKAAAAMLEYEHEKDDELVDDVIDLAKSGGRGMLGTQVVNEFELKNVELLLVPWPSPNARLVDHLVITALKSGAAVRPVQGNSAEHLIAEAGIAARLYYSHPVLN